MEARVQGHVLAVYFVSFSYSSLILASLLASTSLLITIHAALDEDGCALQQLGGRWTGGTA